jgi:3-oxoacyl-[acyl-carrier-protein] synthase III
MGLSLIAMGSVSATTVINNHFLEGLETGTNAEWIEEKIGVIERVSTLPLEYIRTTRNREVRQSASLALESTSTLGVKAIHKALHNANLRIEDIGLIICNSCTPDTTAPSQAETLGALIGSTAVAFDLVSACPAFALHIHFLYSMKPERLPKYILCVCTATFTQTVNYDDRTDGAIWGDGATAYILSTEVEGLLTVLDTTFEADPSRCGAVVIEREGHFHQDGRAVRDFSVRQTVRMIKAFEEKHPLDWKRDVFIGHQANRTMLEQVVNNRKIPARNHWHNVTYLGNQGAAGAPGVLAENWENIVPGQHVVVAVVGAGLSWGSLLFKASI